MPPPPPTHTHTLIYPYILLLSQLLTHSPTSSKRGPSHPGLIISHMLISPSVSLPPALYPLVPDDPISALLSPLIADTILKV